MTQGCPVDGVTHEVGNPFMDIATQNPIEQAGNYRLPEAQLDRFVMTASIGCPDHASSVQIRQSSATRGRSRELTPRVSLQAVNDLTQLASTAHVDPAVLEYVPRLMEETRLAPEVLHELPDGPVRDALQSFPRALVERRR